MCFKQYKNQKGVFSGWLVKNFLICIHYLVATVIHQLLLKQLYDIRNKFRKWYSINLDNI
jgi:formylmethanofuran dehydrogenase subunit A